MAGRVKFADVSTGFVDVAGVEDLKASLLWFHSLLPATAKEELAIAQRQGSLLTPVVFTDGKKGRDEDLVKPFGTITYSDSVGPLREAIAMAWAIVQGAAPRLSGHYQRSLQWVANGQLTGGPPDPERVGARGNVQLVDLAPYASTLEIQVPRGVIYSAYTQLARRFGRQLLISYGYGKAAEFGGLDAPAGRPPLRPYAVPILTIGNPASTVNPKATRPGAAQRRRKRRTDRWQGFDKGRRI
jgi:hypothetical protein